MDTQTLVEALRGLQPEEMSWKLALYNTRKGRDGLELGWNLCAMNGAAAWAEILRTTLLEKSLSERTVTEYSPFLSDKEHIGALAKTNEMIREQISDILLSVQNGDARAPEEFFSGRLPKPAGFAFYGESRDEQGKIKEQVLFMRRGNPFLSGGKALLCLSDGEAAVACGKPLLKFTPAADFLYIGGICYFLASAIEKDFALESRHAAVAAKRLKAVSEAGIINCYDQLEEAAMKAANARKFAGFDKQILEHIARLGVLAREEFLGRYGLAVDREGRVETRDPEQCELLIDLLCCRSCLDPLGRLATADNITPRE